MGIDHTPQVILNYYNTLSCIKGIDTILVFIIPENFILQEYYRTMKLEVCIKNDG